MRSIPVIRVLMCVNFRSFNSTISSLFILFMIVDDHYDIVPH